MSQTIKKKQHTRKRERVKKKLLRIIGTCALVMLTFSTAAASEKSGLAVISLTPESASIYQDEKLPEFTAKVKSEGSLRRVLEKGTGYTAKDFVEELKEGEYYTVACDTDGTKEGSFPLTVKLDEELRKKLENEWSADVFIETADAKLTVKNKYGELEGSKLKRPDGTYLTNGWAEVKGEKYYFDGDGNKVTGELKLGLKNYEFDEDGKLLSEETRVDVDAPMVALTFDDGPGERTGELLDQLEKYNSKATFFMLGQKVSGYSDVVRRMEQMGMETANHSMTHANLSTLDASGIQSEVDGANEEIEKAGGGFVDVMRPPYGAVNETVSASVKMPMIMWSVDTLDWKTKNAKATVDKVMSEVTDGDIILFHDIHTTTIDAMMDLIPKLVEDGYQLVTVSELAEARGIELEDGKQYFSFHPDETGDEEQQTVSDESEPDTDDGASAQDGGN